MLGLRRSYWPNYPNELSRIIIPNEWWAECGSNWPNYLSSRLWLPRLQPSTNWNIIDLMTLWCWSLGEGAKKKWKSYISWSDLHTHPLKIYINFWKFWKQNDVLVLWTFDPFISSDRSSYSDSVLLLVRRQLFQILSIYANIFVFIYMFVSFWELNADW